LPEEVQQAASDAMITEGQNLFRSTSCEQGALSILIVSIGIIRETDGQMQSLGRVTQC
jgi:hypothetical protein